MWLTFISYLFSFFKHPQFHNLARSSRELPECVNRLFSNHLHSKQLDRKETQMTQQKTNQNAQQKPS